MHPEVTLTFEPLRVPDATCEWDSTYPPKNIKIKVDNDKAGRIQCIVHELLHVVYHDHLSAMVEKDMHEAAIEVWELLIMDYIRKSPKALKVWRKAIALKLQSQQMDEDNA